METRKTSRRNISRFVTFIIRAIEIMYEIFDGHKFILLQILEFKIDCDKYHNSGNYKVVPVVFASNYSRNYLTFQGISQFNGRTI